MEFFLRWGLLLIGAFVVSLIFYDVWFRRSNRLEKEAPLPVADSMTEPSLLTTTNFILEEDGLLSPVDAATPLAAEPRIKTQEQRMPTDDDILIISVLANPGTSFASYDLIQAIAATGMRFGEMDIFHYYQVTDFGNVALFSLASATKPGKFDLNKIGDFSCAGLSLFMDKTAVDQPRQVFLTMLEKAEQLAEDLGGELRAGPERKPWNELVLQHYLNSL